jgi:maleate isomerase
MTAPHRVGLIVPSSNVTMETELPALLSRHPVAAGRGVTFHSSQISDSSVARAPRRCSEVRAVR